MKKPIIHLLVRFSVFVERKVYRFNIEKWPT